jgi:bacterial/archaeal transporter family protein
MQLLNSQSWLLYALGSAFFAGATAILAKLGVQQMNSNLATFFRTLVILCFTALTVTFRSEWQRPAKISTSGVIFLTASGVATALSWLCYFRALQLGPASKVAPVDKLSVVIVVVLAMTILGETMNWQALSGVGLIFVGTLLVALA